MPAMIDYAVLCRAIEDWKAGNAPNIPVSSRPLPVATEAVVDSYDAVEDAGEDVVESDVDGGEDEVEVDGGEPQQDHTIVYHLPDVEEGEEEEQA